MIPDPFHCILVYSNNINIVITFIASKAMDRTYWDWHIKLYDYPNRQRSSSYSPSMRYTEIGSRVGKVDEPLNINQRSVVGQSEFL